MLSVPSTARSRGHLPVGEFPDLTSWRAAGACGSADLNLFFVPDGVPAAERTRRENAAKQVCAQCSVQVKCLRYAVGARERFGIWGGTTPAERLPDQRRPDERRAARTGKATYSAD